MGAGCKYMVLDAGGGTVDIAVHETKDDGKLREVYMANGGDWGGTKVDEGFQNFLADLMSPRTNSSDKGIVELEGGKKVLKAFEENYIDEDLEMKRDFEQKKRGIKELMTSKLTMRISPELHEAFAQIYPGENLKELDLNRFDGNVKWVHDTLQINNPVACSFFKEPINKIVEHVKQIFSKPELEGTERILMVGGFSECPLLVSAIRKAFPSKVVIVPRDAGLVVLKGAVIFGHDQNVFCERISKYTYGLKCEGRFIRREHPLEYRFIDKDGTEWCHNLFDIHVKIGQAIRFGEPQSIRFYQPSRFVKDGIFHFSIFGTKSKKPKFVTDNGVHKAGQVTLRIPPDDVDYDSEITVSLTFSGTELEAVAEYRKTGQKEKSYIGYLE